jgi:hypothetical protein
MSTAVVQAPVQPARSLTVIEGTAPLEVKSSPLIDEHPFAVVGIFIVISLAAAGIFVGSIVFWLSIRYSGVLGVKF